MQPTTILLDEEARKQVDHLVRQTGKSKERVVRQSKRKGVWCMIPAQKQKLTKLVTKMRHHDVHPIYLPDVEYQHGDKRPLIPLLEATVSELHEYLLLAKDDELKATYEALDSYYR